MDRGKSGTALHLACDSRAMPLGVVVTGANANDGVQTKDVLESLVVAPPPAEVPVANPDQRDWLPTARRRGLRQQAHDGRGPEAGFRMEAPQRGRTRPPGVGASAAPSSAATSFLAQFGRIARRLDRSAKRYLGWIELAACVIFVRAEAHGFFR